MAVVIGILVLIVGMQIGYGVMRRLEHRQPVRERFGRYRFDGAEEGRPSEWGNGFTQFPLDFLSMKPMSVRARSR